jgi:hypothetical protein
MQLAEYLMHYDKFNEEFFSGATLEEIEDKMVEELKGMYTALHNLSTDERINEALDVMNMSIKLLTAYGVTNVLDAGYRKLMATAEEYRGIRGN